MREGHRPQSRGGGWRRMDVYICTDENYPVLQDIIPFGATPQKQTETDKQTDQSMNIKTVAKKPAYELSKFSKKHAKLALRPFFPLSRLLWVFWDLPRGLWVFDRLRIILEYFQVELEGSLSIKTGLDLRIQ